MLMLTIIVACTLIHMNCVDEGLQRIINLAAWVERHPYVICVNYLYVQEQQSEMYE